MPGSNITTDALRMALILDIEGGEEALAKLQRVSNLADAVNAKTKRQQDELNLQRMEVEGKYDAEAQRNYEIEKAIKLTDRLNLSLKTQDAILEEIEAKYQKAIAPPVTKEGPQQDAHVLSFLAAQEKADREFLAHKQRIAKEIERIEEESLTRSQRYVKQLTQLQADRDKGLTDQSGFLIRARALKESYDEEIAAEQRLAQAKAEAVAKQAAADAAKLARRKQSADEEARAINVEIARRNQADRDSIVDANQRRARATIEAEAAALAENNRVRQEAISLMRGYETAAQRAEADTLRLNAALASGTITAAEHAQAIDNIATRQRMMAGGAGNLGYMVGNLATGMEDFVTVLSITGFGMDGFAAATRSASNNVGQAVRGLGTAAAAIAAPLVSIGVVLGGFAIAGIYKWIMGTEDAAKATKKFADEIERLGLLASKINREALADLQLDFKLEDVGDIKTQDELDRKIKETERQIEIIKEKKEELNAIMKGQSEAAFDKMVPVNSEADLRVAAEAFDKIMQGNGAIENHYLDQLKEIKKIFINESRDIGGEEARKHLEANMRRVTEELTEGFDDLSASEKREFRRLIYQTTGDFNDMMNIFSPQFLNDSAVVDMIQSMEGELAELNDEQRKEHSERVRELEEQIALLKELQDQREAVAEAVAEAQAQAAHLDRQAMDDQLEMMRIQSKRNTLLGEENEAERRILDLALRRKEIMESGVAAPDVLEGMVNAELLALQADLEKQIAKADEVKAQTGVAGQAEAYAQANKMALEAAGKPENTEQKEIVQLLKAIKDHLSGAKLMNVEVM